MKSYQEIKRAFSMKVFADSSEFTNQEQNLFKSARSCCQQAYAPYSKFKVGAAVLLDNDEIVSGNNQENAAYPSGLCAERVALFYAGAQFPDAKMLSIALTIDYELSGSDDFAFPCGACRQVLAEYEHKSQGNLKIYLLGKNDSVAIIESVKDLLPFYFNDEFLSK